jgi:tetratricopeptide (TPR) repeat protein
MSLKLIAAALTLAFAITGAPASFAAGEATKTSKRTAPPPASTRHQGEDLLARTVFQTLVGELALQRGDIKLGLDAWTDLAQRTRDPKVIARATEVAGFARQYDHALELSKLWLSVEPNSAKARQMQSSLLVMANRLDELAPQMSKLLEQDPDNLSNNLLHLNRILSRIDDKRAVQHLIDRVAMPYAQVPEAHFAMAQAAANANDNLRALNEAEKALLLRPSWEMAAIARAQLQIRLSPATAIDSLLDFSKRYPEAGEARLTLARLLISEKRYDEARHHYEKLIRDNPDNPEIIYPVAMLALQHGDTATGRTQLERLLQSSHADKSTIHFFLGQIDEEQQNADAALDHYHQVNGGEQFITARTRIAQILQQKGKINEARDLLRSTSASGREKTQLLLAESQLLRDAGRPAEALSLLDNALTSQPDNPDLLYEAALLAERQGKPEILEKRLRHLLKLKPDHAHALNALGYSLAERNIRLAEAEQLITKAVSLAPEDPFIMDSLGWVQYRLGRLQEALQTLRRAYNIKADPEIAAHLGEVLWADGQRDAARQLLKAAASQHPTNEVLAGTIKKLLP